MLFFATSQPSSKEEEEGAEQSGAEQSGATAKPRE
jgi:hypothetical protein